MHINLERFGCPFAPWRPADGRVFDRFSLDTETTDIDDNHPSLIPVYVLGAACDGQRGVFLTRDNLLPFFQAHAGVPFVCHNAAFDLKVCNALLSPTLDLYNAVEQHRVWDTLILNRLLSLATAGHTARGESSLADCVAAHLGIALDKGQQDSQGQKVRTGFGQFLGRPPSNIPAAYLSYLGRDAIATWHLFEGLHRRIQEVLQTARGVYGYAGDDWLRDAVQRFGPLTHHVQLRASIVMDVLRANGIGIDQARQEEKAGKVRAEMEACRQRLHLRGYLPGEPGCDKSLQSILSQFKRENPDVELKTTPTGKWSTAEENLAELAAVDTFFADFSTFKTCEKLLSTYLKKMGQPRLHPKFGYLLETGRTYCGGGFNLQNLPREKEAQSAAGTVRGCFVPAEGHVFIDSDFAQIELVVLGHALQRQFGLRSELARLINQGEDVHRLVAGTMLGKEPKEVSKEERNSVKAVSFGRPGGMGVGGLRKVARASYGIELTDAEVRQRIDAYHRLCPELDAHLSDEVDHGRVIAETLCLTPAEYYRGTGRGWDPQNPEAHRPQGWLGGMLLKVLKEEQPCTRRGQGRPYTPEEIDFFWEHAQRLPLPLKSAEAALLQKRQASPQLFMAVRNWAGRRAVFTVTGRLRANTTFCSSRNAVFQGPAADGAILALWGVWRAGHRLVDFVHDQLVVESPADDRVPERAAAIERLMKEGMAQVVPGMLVNVETVFTRSLNKTDRDPRYYPEDPRLEGQPPRADILAA